ncbi:sodium:solute symporter family transporter [Sulfuriroseicoccus oceanibius]|uniref:Sodium/solute symporter n=1 Tax=Sulfuriroseicoccus oceanibius TaxID=2707525 RepID=A0A7T7F1L3_9BACT|nr:sodium/solute symporter [Sulfuriroseicoccus oceanibius]QQL45150.1 sodium/solute symporter [Sulfuriroseicoccus oceanibius]
MNYLELVLFVGAVIGVITLGIWKSKGERTHDSEKGASDYFLAGRGLTWWLVGFSLIAANISTEQFVGMSGQAADWLGMAIASYEWMAAVTLVIVGFWFLPKFLKAGLYTIPEFLQYRFDGVARMAMAIPMIVTLVFVTTSSVIFSGGKFISEYYKDVPVLNNLTAVCWLIAAAAAIYVFIGGLKAAAWTDLIWGAALIVGGAIVMFLAFSHLSDAPAEELIKTKVANSTATVEDIENAGAIDRLILLNDGKEGEAVAQNGPNGSGGKMHMIRPKEDTDIPWTALLLGLWIPNLYYWGLNQYIVQRTLGSKSLAEGQKGIVFAAGLKLVVPFLVVIPGILAFNLFSGDLHDSAETRNSKAMEGIKETQAIKVDRAFVTMQPEQVAVLVERNAKLAGEEVEVPAEATPEDLVALVNGLADKAVEKDVEANGDNATIAVGPKMVGYDYDAAFPILVRNLVKDHWYISWFVLAALCGAVISSLASMLNSASTIATMDLYANFSGQKDQAKLVVVGRVFVILFVILAGLIAPALNNFSSIFAYIQEFQGFISPGILAVFIFGFFSPRTPRWFGAVGIGLNIVSYAAFKWVLGPWITKNGWWYSDDMAFLDRMGLCFIIVLLAGAIVTMIAPMRKPVEMPETKEIELETSSGAKLAGGLVVLATLALYVIFW